jgi:hypothetical protein
VISNSSFLQSIAINKIDAQTKILHFIKDITVPMKFQKCLYASGPIIGFSDKQESMILNLKDALDPIRIKDRILSMTSHTGESWITIATPTKVIEAFDWVEIPEAPNHFDVVMRSILSRLCTISKAHKTTRIQG